MTSALQKILESKHALRRDLASRPVAEKLRLLDAMREREVTIRGAVTISTVGAIARDLERQES